MIVLQIALIAILGAACVANYATSQALHMPRDGAEQGGNPAPPKVNPERG